MLATDIIKHAWALEGDERQYVIATAPHGLLVNFMHCGFPPIKPSVRTDQKWLRSIYPPMKGL